MKNTMTYPKNMLSLALVTAVLMVLATTRVNANAPITWTVGNISGPSDVDTNGTLVMAFNLGDANNAATINGVNFAADPGAASNLTGGGATVSVPLTFLTPNTYGTWNQTGAAASYGAALNAGRYQYNGLGAAVPFALTMNDLTVGAVYHVQLWDDDARGGTANKTETLSDGNVNAVTLNNLTGPHWAIGTFTATNATETITVTPQTPTYGGGQLNLFQLRVIATNIPVAITTQPQSQTNWVGNPVTFSVLVYGSPPLFYQWFAGADPVVGATNASYTIASVQATNSGSTYHVQVSNPFSSANSTTATLTVNPPITWTTGNISSPADVDITGTLVLACNLGDVANSATINGVTFAADPGAGTNLTGGGVTVSVPLPLLATSVYGTWNQTGAAASYGTALSSGRYQYNGFGTAIPIAVTISGLTTGTEYRVQFWDADARGGDQFKWETFSTRSNSVSLNNYVGGPQWAIGTFKALSSTETITITPQTPAWGGAQLNLFQLRLLVTNVPVAIAIQPTNRTVTVGGNVTFTVTAGGTPPFSYQWLFNDTNVISGATNAVFTLANVQFTNAGNYSVIVSNGGGHVTSSNAVLTVNLPPPCVSPTNLISWWRGEGDAVDFAGLNNGTLINGATFGAGKVGQAFSLNGVNQYVQVPDNNLWAFGTNNFSIELWANITALYGGHHSATFINNDEGEGPSNKWFFWLGDGVLQFHVNGPATGPYFLVNAPFAPALGLWYHYAITRSDNLFTIYVNGVAVGSEVSNPNIPNPNAPLWIGRLETDYFNGRLDEVSIYNRGLSAGEVQAIYGASVSGKCVIPIAPTILTQPTNQTVLTGGTATFTVTAGGTPPFSYQWVFNDTNVISGVTISSLTLANVQFTNAGNYSVIVSNGGGHVTSSNAVLTVVFPPAVVQLIGNSNVLAGATTIIPVQLVANGNENALGLSVNFDPALFAFSSVTQGSGATNASLIYNTNQTNSGKLGLLLGLGSGQTFAAGPQVLALVTFDVIAPAVSSNRATSMTFGDVPTTRQLVDAGAANLSAYYSNANLLILAAGWEADTAPRTNGDQQLTAADWVQVGRFVAKLDIANDGSEYQRADCAPRATLGNGVLSITDWVQAGRYAAGLDPLTLAGGPTTEGLGPLTSPKPGKIEPKGFHGRTVRVVNQTLQAGTTSTVAVQLDAQGDENALGFSLNFNPAVFQFVSATLGSGASLASFNVNADQAAAGKLGVAFALPTGNNFPPATVEVVKVSLAVASTAAGTSDMTFVRSPISMEVSDPTANALTTSFVPGTLTISPFPPVLRIATTGADVTLSWPVVASNYVLQVNDTLPGSTWSNAASPVVVGADNVVTATNDHGTKFYRLFKP